MFLELLKKNLQEGILLLVKYGLIIIAIVYAYLFMQNTYQMANNGNSAALYIVELQKKGWLPPVTNGQVPMKDIGEKK